MKLLSIIILSSSLLLNAVQARIITSQYVIWVTQTTENKKEVTNISNPISLPADVSISEINYMFSKHVAQKFNTNSILVSSKNIQMFPTKEKAFEFQQKSMNIYKNLGKIVVEDIVLPTDSSIVPQARIQAIDNITAIFFHGFFPIPLSLINTPFKRN